MNRVYFESANPGSFGGVRKYYKQVKKINPDFSETQARHYLSGQDTYTLYKPRRRRFPRNKFIMNGIDDLWQSDLADLSSLSDHNDGYRYLLVTIDSLSKFAWALPTKTKRSAQITNVIKKTLAQADPRRPKNWLVDKGGEFQGRGLKEFMLEQSINFYTTRNPDTKAAMAERFIRTLKGKIFRFLTYNNSWRYLEEVQVLVDSYNNTRHRSIGVAPIDVTEGNVKEIMAKLYPAQENMKVNYSFNVGDKVRLAKEHTVFAKGFRPGWTEEVFVVTKRIPRFPPVYTVADANGEEIEGTFYKEELQKVNVTDDSLFKIDSILSERTVNGKREYLVKWRGYPNSMASWEPEDNIQMV